MDGYKLRQEAARHLRMAVAFKEAEDVVSAALSRDVAIGMVRAAAALEQLERLNRG